MTRKIPIISLEDFEAKAKKPTMMKSLVSNINENLRKHEFSQISELALSEVSLCEYKLI